MLQLLHRNEFEWCFRYIYFSWIRDVEFKAKLACTRIHFELSLRKKLKGVLCEVR